MIFLISVVVALLVFAIGIIVGMCIKCENKCYFN